MKRTKENLIVQETFLAMCKILKDREGIYHREIAVSIDVDTSLLSRWINGSHNISRFYNDRIYTYLNQTKFEYLNELLKNAIIQRLKLNPRGKTHHNILSLNYTNLLKYLFYGLTIDVLEREDRLRYLYFDMAKNTLIRKTMDKSMDGKEFRILEDIYYDIKPAVQLKCEMLQITNRNTMIIEVKLSLKQTKRIIVLFGLDHGDTSVDAKLDFIMAEQYLGRFDQYIMVTNPCEYISQSYQSFEYRSPKSGDIDENTQSMQTSFVDIENINISKVERYVDFLVGKVLNTISEYEPISAG